MLTSKSIIEKIPIKGRYLYLIFVIIFLILFVISAEHILKYFLFQNLEEIISEKETRFENEVKFKFDSYQRDLQESIESVKNKINTLSKNNSINQAKLFDILDSISDEGLAIILYDSNGKLIAWKNPFTYNLNLNQIGLNNFFISQSNVYKVLNLSSSIQINRDSVIYIVVSRLLDQNVRISNRFIQPSSHQKIFSQEFKRKVFLIDDMHHGVEKQKFKTIQLFSLDNSPLTYVSYFPLTVDDIYFDLESYFKVIKVFLGFVLGSILFGVIFFVSKRIFTTAIKEFVLIVEIWLFRYFLLWIGFPSEITDVSIFNPSYFASSFGFGLAKSIAELLITSIALFLSVLYLTNVFSYIINNESLKPKNYIYKYLVVILSILIILILLRGYVATLISAIQDSNLNYVQQTEVVPTFEKLVMFVALILLSFSFVILGLNLVKLSQSILLKNSRTTTAYIILIILTFTVPLFFRLHPSPLFTYSQSLLILLGLIGLSKIIGSIDKIVFSKDFVLLILFSSILMVSLFYSEIEQDREQKLVDLANQVVQPFDDWMAFIVDEALGEMLSILENKNTLNNNQDLAFNLWLNSIISQKGYDCKLTVIDSNFRVVSRFGIGSLTAESQKLDFIPDKKIVKVNELKFERGEVKYYSGYVPIYDKSNKIVGAILLDVAASRRELLSQDKTSILAAGRYERDYYFYKTFYNEFEDQYISYSTNQEFSKYIKIPEIVLANLNKNKKYYCVEEIINNKRYQSVYINANGKNKIVSVNVEIPSWKKFEVFRLFIYIIFLSLFLLFLISLGKLKNIFRLSFFTKLLIIFILVSMIPLFIFGYYNNIYTEERMNSEMINNLGKEIELVINQLSGFISENKYPQEVVITDELCEDISKKTGVDFIFYSNALYAGSSLSEFIQAELISNIISANAYKKIVIEGSQFFVEARRIGTFSYYVGYKPVFDYSKNISGIITVLTLSKIAMLEAEIAHRNMYMFGIYFIVLLFVIVIGLTISSKIARPLKNLLNYTRIVGTGNLDVRINSKRKDEIGELENAFDKMAADLKLKRDELIKYEKEIAWKEMAKQVAHEIKNPLTPIKLAIQQLYKAYKDGAKNFDEIFGRAYDMITEQIEALSRIASEFSNFARMPVRNLEICSVNEIMDNAIQLFAQYPNVKINRNYCKEKLRTIADKDELRRAFVNIIRNSVQAMEYQGTIDVSITKLGNMIQIDIIDNGPGIPDEIAKRIFEPNFSTKSDGMGLGLAIVKRTIDDLNGEITFETKLGYGTKFTIKLNIANTGEDTNN